MAYTDFSSLLAVNWVQVAISLIAIFARLWAVVRVTGRRLEASEYFIIAYIPILLFGAAVDTYLLRRIQFPPTTPSSTIRYLKLSYANGYSYYLGGFAIRGGLIGLYFQLCRRLSSKKLRLVLWGSAGYLFVAFVASMIINLAACIPMNRNWSLTNYCTALEKRWVFGVLSFLLLSTDALLLGLAATIAAQIEVARIQRIAIISMLAVGGTSAAACALRTAEVNRTLELGLSMGERQQAALATMFWSCLELLFALLAGCLPSYRALWRSAFNTMPSTSKTYAFSYERNGSSFGRRRKTEQSSDEATLTKFSTEKVDSSGIE